MEIFGKILLMGGLAITLLAQIIGAGIAFRLSLLKGVFSLIIPGYLLLALQRDGSYWKVVGLWTAGILGIALGTIALA